MSWLTGRHSLYRAEETSFIVLLEVFVQLTVKLTAPLSCNLLGLFTGHSSTNNAIDIPEKLILRQEINVSRPVFSAFSQCNCFCFRIYSPPSWFPYSKLILLITSLNVLPIVFLQGGRLYIFWNGNRQAIFPWLHSRRSTSFNIQGEYEMNLIIAGDKRSPHS